MKMMPVRLASKNLLVQTRDWELKQKAYCCRPPGPALLLAPAQALRCWQSGRRVQLLAAFSLTLFSCEVDRSPLAVGPCLQYLAVSGKKTNRFEFEQVGGSCNITLVLHTICAKVQATGKFASQSLEADGYVAVTKGRLLILQAPK